MKKLYYVLMLLVLTSFKSWKSVRTNSDSQGKRVTVFTTADKTDLRITKSGTLSFANVGQPMETDVCVFVDPGKTFQTLVGIGGALTDASAEVFAKLDKTRQQKFLKAYFDPKDGIGYTLARTSIHSCDFSSGSYTYVDEKDESLKSFSVKHDEQYRIPFIKQSIAAAGGRLTMFVSPWSPPGWMKDNNEMLHGGKLLAKYRQSWANYYIKFINAYEKQGIPIWGLTMQNEPMAKQTWESCMYTAEEERDFIKQYLGPTLQKAGMANRKLIAWDHNRDLIYQRASTILADPAAAKFIWGIGYHWYETWTGSSMLFDNLRRVKEAFPDKELFFTEGCLEKMNFDKIGMWEPGEKYAHSMVNDFNCGTAGWTDWNILLDEQGGPNHVGNYCYAPVIADTRDGSLHFTSSYYYIGHFSKFIRPGAKRIATSSNRDKLQTTAFINSDGKIAVVVLNTSDDALDYTLWIDGKGAKTKSLAHSINTLVIE